MYTPRRIETSPDWLDQDGIRIYTISASGGEVPHPEFLPRLQEVKSHLNIRWSATLSFAIQIQIERHRRLVRVTDLLSPKTRAI